MANNGYQEREWLDAATASHDVVGNSSGSRSATEPCRQRQAQEEEEEDWEMQVECDEEDVDRFNGSGDTGRIAEPKRYDSADSGRPFDAPPSSCKCFASGAAAEGAMAPVAPPTLMGQKDKVGLATLGSELICAICQELFVEASTVECGHSFCRMCIENWLKTKLSCPICRHPINKPPISSVCLDKAVRVMLEIAEEKQAATQLMERQRLATQARQNECFAQSCLETLFQKAVQQGVRVVHISKQWSPREQQRFLCGIERHQGVARETYCRVVGLTYEWIGRATPDELLIAAANVKLRDMENRPTCPAAWKQSCVTKLRARLEMYIRYG